MCCSVNGSLCLVCCVFDSVCELFGESTMHPLHIRVPQGSILGPILFILYLNDFHLSSSKFNFQMYADDTTLTSTRVFHTQHKHVIYPDVFINDINVEIVHDFRLLGITINKNLKLHIHTDNISIKVSKYIGALNRLKHTLPPRILLTLYNTLILPHPNLGLLIRGGHDNNRLCKPQNLVI